MPGRPRGRKDSAPRRKGKARKTPPSCQTVSSGDVGTTIMDAHTMKLDRFHPASGSTKDHIRSATPPPLISDDPFHDDWPHWSRADACQLQGSPALPAAEIKPLLQSKETTTSFTAAAAAAPYQPRRLGSGPSAVLSPRPQPTHPATPAPAHGLFLPFRRSGVPDPAETAAGLPPPPRPWPGDEAVVAAVLAEL